MVPIAAFEPLHSAIDKIGEQYLDVFDTALKMQRDAAREIVNGAMRRPWEEIAGNLTVMADHEIRTMDMSKIQIPAFNALAKVNVDTLRPIIETIWETTERLKLVPVDMELADLTIDAPMASGPDIERALTIGVLVLVYVMVIIGSRAFWLSIPAEDRLEFVGAVSTLIALLLHLDVERRRDSL